MDDAEARQAEFQRVALPYLDRAFQFAMRLTRNRTEAEDLVQETYLRAWKYFGSFKPGADGRVWIFQILYNAFLADRNKAKRREAPLPEEEGADEFLLYKSMVQQGGWKDPLELSPERFGHLLGDEVRRALDRLPHEFRFPLLLCDVDDMSYAEIAGVMNCPPGTVRSRISRARGLLQRELEAYARKNGYFKGGKEDT